MQLAIPILEFRIRPEQIDAVVNVVGIVPGEPALRGLGPAGADNDTAGACIVFGLDSQIAAELQAGVGAGNVVEPITVQAADFHVLNRRRL